MLIPVNESGCVAHMHQATESLIKSHSWTQCHTCAAHAWNPTRVAPACHTFISYTRALYTASWRLCPQSSWILVLFFFPSHVYKEMKWCIPRDKVGFIFSCIFLYSFFDWYDHLCNVCDIISSLQIWLFSKMKAPISQYSITRGFLTALNRRLCENISAKYIKSFVK